MLCRNFNFYRRKTFGRKILSDKPRTFDVTDFLSTTKTKRVGHFGTHAAPFATWPQHTDPCRDLGDSNLCLFPQPLIRIAHQRSQETTLNGKKRANANLSSTPTRKKNRDNPRSGHILERTLTLEGVHEDCILSCELSIRLEDLK